ncbi:MAG TPA: choice-of-anchor D domain-containing protein, partial [Candidatus Binatia bacterium]|nr:choice-of-anchor D domain-containing protein [Candidatus Binatia bacterium]
ELGALGTLTLTGSTINVSGGKGGDAGYRGSNDGGSGLAAGGGGGSGGAVLLHATTVTLGGAINAQAGNGGIGRGNGDDGGGGRIVIQATADPGTEGISVAGGSLGGSPRVGVIAFIRPTLTPTNLDYGSVPVGSSITTAITIRNTGDEGSFINGQFPAASAPFARVGTGIFTGLKTDASTTCEYTFAPTAVGAFSQKIEILSNAGAMSVTISGTGSAPPTPAAELPNP